LAAAGLLLAGLLATAAGAVEPRALVGKYTCKGVNPDGEKFDHPAEIILVKGKTLLIYFDSDEPDIGLCALRGNKLTVRFQGVKDPNTTGEAEYQLGKDGVLKGRWRYKGDKWMPESLIPVKKPRKK
jgi:hypothetical protein